MTRVIQQISMVDRRTDVFNRHTDASGFKKIYQDCKDTLPELRKLDGVYHLAYLADPQLNFCGNLNFKVYYN